MSSVIPQLPLLPDVFLYDRRVLVFPSSFVRRALLHDDVYEMCHVSPFVLCFHAVVCASAHAGKGQRKGYFWTDDVLGEYQQQVEFSFYLIWVCGCCVSP